MMYNFEPVDRIRKIQRCKPNEFTLTQRGTASERDLVWRMNVQKSQDSEGHDPFYIRRLKRYNLE